jgi:hypothetical protein
MPTTSLLQEVQVPRSHPPFANDLEHLGLVKQYLALPEHVSAPMLHVWLQILQKTIRVVFITHCQ